MLQHELNIGLLDKDSKTQLITAEQATDIIGGIVGDCTVKTGATGFYTHDDGSKVKEPSLEVVIYGGTQKAVIAKVRELKIALNQESIVYNCKKSTAKFI